MTSQAKMAAELAAAELRATLEEVKARRYEAIQKTQECTVRVLHARIRRAKAEIAASRNAKVG